MKKKIIIIILLIIVLISGCLIFYYLNQPSVTLNKKTIPLNQETRLDEIILVKKGELVDNKKINTKKLGQTKITVQVLDFIKRKHTYEFKIDIIDTEKPIINYQKEIKIEAGTKTDLLKNVTASDNSKEEIKVTVDGKYDLNKAGEYKIYYIAKDASGNEAKEEAKLTVTAKSNSANIVTKNFTTSKGFKGVTKGGVTYIDGILVVNKTYSLPSNYGNGLTSTTLNAFNKMKTAASKEGLNIYISSGFRSYTRQNSIYNNYVKQDGKAKADTYSARPGHSEHQTGLAYDVNTISPAFDNTKEAKWLANNCYKYGFILRYPKGKDNETGYMYESWHFRYVGEDLATKLYNNGDWITLETYFGITSAY